MNELICSMIHIYYGRIPLQTDFFLSLIKPVFQHQHIKSVNIRLAIFIFNMSASIKNKPNRHRLNYRHIEHTNNIHSVDGRRVWGFKGIRLMIDAGVRSRDGLLRVYAKDNPFT